MELGSSPGIRGQGSSFPDKMNKAFDSEEKHTWRAYRPQEKEELGPKNRSEESHLIHTTERFHPGGQENRYRELPQG